MNLQNELEKLSEVGGTGKFDKQLKRPKDKFTSAEDKKVIAAFARKFADIAIADADRLIEEASVKLQISKTARLLSLSYIAETYFNKSRAWLCQRVSGNVVNGKPARFTPDKIKTFNRAVKEVSKEIGCRNYSMNLA